MRPATEVPRPRVEPRESLPKPAALPRPHLVAAPSARTTVGLFPFVALIGALLVGGLVAVLMLHMFAAQDAFQVTAGQSRLAALNDEAQSLQQKVADDSAPTRLRQQAAGLGMRPSTVSHYKRLKDGRVTAVRSAIPYVPPVTPTTKATTRASATTTDTAKGTTAKGTTAKSGTTTSGTTTSGTTTSGTTTSGTTTSGTTTTSGRHHTHRPTHGGTTHQ